MSKKKTVTDRAMQVWWRRAILASHNNTCAVCGRVRSSSDMECHHLIKRRYRILRHDYRNGVPVCVGDCHRKADNNSGWLISKHQYREHLTDITSNYTTIKDFLIDRGMTLAEHDAQMLEELKEVAGRFDNV
ncbi:MAG: HNH endonuclease signature motif containing protein [Gammaproteobacteria bacterium]|jgi:5-methylcytosine-specific restriction endonuclease McrA